MRYVGGGMSMLDIFHAISTKVKTTHARHRCAGGPKPGWVGHDNLHHICGLA